MTEAATPGAATGGTCLALESTQARLELARAAAVGQGGAGGVNAGETGAHELFRKVLAIGKNHEGIEAVAVVHALPAGVDDEAAGLQQGAGELARVAAEGQRAGIVEPAEIAALIAHAFGVLGVQVGLGAVGEIQAKMVGEAAMLDLEAVAIVASVAEQARALQAFEGGGGGAAAPWGVGRCQAVLPELPGRGGDQQQGPERTAAPAALEQPRDHASSAAWSMVCRRARRSPRRGTHSSRARV